jgi:Domain of unknown function (DUF222)
MSPVGSLVEMEVLAVADIAHAGGDECAALLGAVRRSRGWLDAVEARITSRLRELHEATGSVPAADAHGRHGGVSAAEGKRKERRSKTIDDAPSFGDALADGTIGAEHVDGLANATARVDDDVRSQLLAEQDVLLSDAVSMTPEEFARHCRDRVRQLERDHGIERNRQQRNDTFLTRKTNMQTGMVDGRFSFHPELANQIFGAVDKEVDAMIAAGERRGGHEFVHRTYDRRRLAAEALGTLVAGGHQQQRPLEADITMICDHATAFTGLLHDHSICETIDGIPVPPATIRRLICNGRITPIIVDANGVPFDMGRQIRTANRAQRRALRAMYSHCAFAGCDIEFNRCEIHHIHPWELGGVTDLQNLLPVCSRHHHVVHDDSWTLQLAPDRTLTITQPDGRHYAQTRPDIPQHRHRRRPTAA